MSLSKTAEIVRRQVKTAYYDCWCENFEKAKKHRNLSFQASDYVTVKEAQEILSSIVPGYNNFNTGLLDHLPYDAKVLIAREGSVCLYIKGQVTEEMAFDKMGVDEFDDEGGLGFRLWWD